MAWLSGQSYNTSCCVLYVLKTRYLILQETIKKSIPVIEPWCDKCMYNLFSSTLIQVFPYSANISDMKWWYANNHMLEIWGFRVIVESNITPKFCACDEGVICESPIVINGRETFDNCWRDPNRRNSVFSSFNFKKFCLIQLLILLNTLLQCCNTRIGRFLRRFESNVKLRVISIDMVI